MREDLAMDIYFAYTDLIKQANAAAQPKTKRDENTVVLRGADAIGMIGGFMRQSAPQPGGK